jgi:hypothetical protein
VKKAFDFTILYTQGEWNVRTINQGIGYKTTNNELRRKDTAILTNQIIPRAVSVKAKNKHYMENFESVKIDCEMFIRNYISQYFPESFDDSVLITNFELITEDPICKFSLEKTAFKIEVIEIWFNADKHPAYHNMPVK